jgi:cytochrome c-type biogenesis protein CcmF
VRWIWGGGLFMMLGGFVAGADKRFRARRAPAPAPAAAEPVVPARESRA